MLDRESGDVVIENGQIMMALDMALEAQNIERLVGTNKGEWWLDTTEGIGFSALLAKNPNFDLVQNEIQAALLRMDDGYVVTEFSHTQTGRALDIRFTAQKGSEKTNIVVSY